METTGSQSSASPTMATTAETSADLTTTSTTTSTTTTKNISTSMFSTMALPTSIESTGFGMKPKPITRNVTCTLPMETKQQEAAVLHPMSSLSASSPTCVL